MSAFDLGASIRQAIAAKQARDLAALRPEPDEPEPPPAALPRVNAGAGSGDRPTPKPATFDDNLRDLVDLER